MTAKKDPHGIAMTDDRFPLERRSLILGVIACGAAIALPGAAKSATPAFSSRRIAVDTIGSGRDVILIPGLGAGPAVWNALVGAVSGYRWHRVHVRGFAGLAAGANAQGPLLDPLADEIARYIAERRLSSPSLIGHSMGGTLAMLAALRHPASSGRVMVVDMLPLGAAMVGGTSAGLGFLSRQFKSYFTGTIAGRRAFAALLRDISPGAASSDADVIAVALDELARIDLGPRLATLKPPLTVVPAIPADARLKASALSRTRMAYAPARGARIVPVEPSGHMVMLDQPAAFARVVKDFLARR